MGQGLNKIIYSLCCGVIFLLAPCYAKVAANGAPGRRGGRRTGGSYCQAGKRIVSRCGGGCGHGLALAEILLYQATVPGKDPPRRDPEELFRAECRALDDLSVHAPWPTYLSAAHLATQRLLEKYQHVLMEDLVKAHQGDAQAMRATAAAYFCGARGHAHSPALGWAWTRRGALTGDIYCMLALTSDPHPPEALAWALLADQMGSLTVRRQAQIVRESLEERITPENKERALKRADELRAMMPSK